MYTKPKTYIEPTLFNTLSDQLNPNHPLYLLSHKIDWSLFEAHFAPLYCSNNGRPCKPIRMMCGLLILKHLRNLSDESVIEQWSENAYYQYFCGLDVFTASFPCTSSELVYFRNRIGTDGIELILKESIRVNEDQDDNTSTVAFIDSTVQEKNITYPTDAKLHKKIIKKCQSIAKREGVEVRQTYTRTLKALSRDQRFRNHPKNRKKALKADSKIRTIAGRLVRELERHLAADSPCRDQLSIFTKVLTQKRKDKDKIYSLHETAVECMSKGKEHKQYEFGNKVSIIRSIGGVILGALSFRKEHDVRTIDSALEQVARLTNRSSKTLACDRGYRGRNQSGETMIVIPSVPKASDTRYQRNKKKKLFCKRAGIEPTIGLLKSDHRLGRNFYKGLQGDAINVMLAAAAYNFKRAMRTLLAFIQKYFLEVRIIVDQKIKFPDRLLLGFLGTTN